jgi:acyl-CoA synthetase (AMP-forming)/AMP-acid ligase II
MYSDEIALIERNSIEGTRREITWRQLDEESNKVANALIERGIRKGDRVLHLMFNSIEWLLVYIGIIRTGACVVPLSIDLQ